MLYHTFIAHKSSSRKLFKSAIYSTIKYHFYSCSQSAAAAASQQQQQQQQEVHERARSNLNVIDFFHPSLSSTLFHYTLNLGVSGYPKSGKIPSETQEQDDLIYSSTQVGDDAYFKRHDALGVADGVGGWRTHKGANPALYSRKLMHYAQLELDRIKTNVRPQQLQVKPDPVQVLESAYHMTTLDAQNEGIVGSTTACIVILCQDELRIANIGDCGISVIRRNDYIFRSEEQQHSFNFPYQLGTASFDSPSDAQVKRTKCPRLH
ncbi:unnamed protein product [Mucor hiemalis]